MPRCKVCGAWFKSDHAVVSHIRFKRDDAHINAFKTNAHAYVEPDPPGAGAPPAVVPAPVAAPVAASPSVNVTAANSSSILNKVCTTMECIREQMKASQRAFEELTKKISERPVASPAASPKPESQPESQPDSTVAQPAPIPQPATPQPAAAPQPQPQASPANPEGHHNHLHNVKSPEEILDHMIECKDGVCRRVLRARVLANHSKLFPGTFLVSQDKYNEYVKWKMAQDASGEQVKAAPAEETPVEKPTEGESKPGEQSNEATESGQPTSNESPDEGGSLYGI